MKLSDQIIAEATKIRADAVLLDMANPNVLIANLVFVHQIIAATEALLALASTKCIPYPLRKYFYDHVKEEKGHADWLAADLATADVDVAKMPLNRRAVELAGAQYYLIRHVAPQCLLGYMAVLEGFPTPVANVDLLEKIHGKRLLRTLRYHAEHDTEHRKEVFEMIDAYPHPAILENAVHTALSINAFAKEIVC